MAIASHPFITAPLIFPHNPKTISPFTKKNFLIASNTLGLNLQANFLAKQISYRLGKIYVLTFFSCSAPPPPNLRAHNFLIIFSALARATWRKKKKPHSCSHPFSPESLIYHPSLYLKNTRAHKGASTRANQLIDQKYSIFFGTTRSLMKIHLSKSASKNRGRQNGAKNSIKAVRAVNLVIFFVSFFAPLPSGGTKLQFSDRLFTTAAVKIFTLYTFFRF